MVLDGSKQSPFCLADVDAEHQYLDYLYDNDIDPYDIDAAAVLHDDNPPDYIHWMQRVIDIEDDSDLFLDRLGLCDGVMDSDLIAGALKDEKQVEFWRIMKAKNVMELPRERVELSIDDFDTDTFGSERVEHLLGCNSCQQQFATDLFSAIRNCVTLLEVEGIHPHRFQD